MNYTLKSIVVPNEINTKLQKINLLIYQSNLDINDYLAKFFVSEDFSNKVFHKKLDKNDWKTIYYSLKEELKKNKFKNNGILFEHFCNKIIGEEFNLKNLVNFGNIDFQDPDKGMDIIFLNEQFKLQFYEVKSRTTINQIGNQNDLIKLIKNAIMSTFCNRQKNVVKLIDAQKAIENNADCIESYNLLEKILENNNLIEYTNDQNIDFNICIIGEQFSIDENKFKQNIIEIFNTTKHCNSKCQFNNKICQNNILDRIKFLNIVNIQFLGELSIHKIYEKIIEEIILMGVLSVER